MILQLAVRNLIRQAERFGVLFLTLALGGWLFVILLGTTSSFSQSLRDRAVRYFAGDVIITGYNDRSVDRWIDDEPAVDKAIRDSGVSIHSWARRSVNYDQNTTLYFSGTSQRQRRLIGVDWTLETGRFKGLDFVSGGPEEMIRGDGILISDSTAKKLKARVGDQLLIAMSTKTGQKNTVNLKIRGIFRDASFFGYSSYVDIRTLNQALGVSGTSVSEIGLILPPGANPAIAAHRIWEALKKTKPVVDFSSSESELDRALSKNIVDGTRKYAVLPLAVRLGPIQEILDALNAVTWSLNLLFLVIVLVGVNNTYRMIVFERIREIGTLRALGMSKVRLGLLFLIEAGLLGLAGAAAGWIVGNFFLWVASLPDFGDNVLMAMFLKRGHFVWTVPWIGLFAATSSLILAALAGAGGPTLRAASWKPVDALRHEA